MTKALKPAVHCLNYSYRSVHVLISLIDQTIYSEEKWQHRLAIYITHFLCTYMRNK